MREWKRKRKTLDGFWAPETGPISGVLEEKVVLNRQGDVNQFFTLALVGDQGSTRAKHIVKDEADAEILATCAFVEGDNPGELFPLEGEIPEVGAEVYIPLKEGLRIAVSHYADLDGLEEVKGRLVTITQAGERKLPNRRTMKTFRVEVSDRPVPSPDHPGSIG